MNGGLCIFNGEYAKDGREVGCVTFSYKSWKQADRMICPKGSEEAGWRHEWVDKVEINNYYDKWTCKKCGEERVVSISAW